MDLDLDIIKTNTLSKFGNDWAKNVKTRILKIWCSDCTFWPRLTNDHTWRQIIKKNILSKFEEDLVKYVAVRV